MTAKRLVTTLACLLTATVPAGLSAAPETPAPRPRNIVLILADDIGWGDLSCYGATRVSTPNVDRLAREGMRLTDAHAPAATCTPTRYAIMTGEYAWRKKGTGIATGDAALIIDPAVRTLPKLLRQAGYATGAVGKWHLGMGPGPGLTDWNTEIVPGPREVGFDYSFLIPATGDRTPCVYVENQRVVNLDPADPIEVSFRLNEDNYPGEPDGRRDRHTLKMDWDFGHNYAVVNGIGRIGYMRGGKEALWKDEDMADTLAEKGAAFIARHKDTPFFLYFATHDIHVPRVPHPRFVGKTGMGPRGDAIVQFDFQVGAILDALDAHGLADDTLVILSSDNGPVLNDGYKDEAVEKLGDHRPAGLFRGNKYSAYEGGNRVPFLVRWPKRVSPGTTSAALVSLVDCMASFATLTGQRLDEADAPDSFDVSAALTDPAAPGRAALISQDPLLSLRQGQWKFIPENNRPKAPPRPLTGLLGDPDSFVKGTNDPGSWNVPQLYDLSADPRETNNLAGADPDRVAAMRAALEKAKADGRTRPLLRASAASPNIVYILADDLGIGDLGCYNPASQIKTPNLDRLAAQGMRFTDAHSPSSVCTPTRYGILTGRYAWRTRLQSGVLFGLSAPLIARDRPTVAALLKAKGYHTACLGKWHLGLGWHGTTTDDPLLKGGDVDYAQPLSDSPLNHGFDTFFGISGSLDMAPYVYIENDRLTALPTETSAEGGRPGPTAPGFKAPDVLPELTRRAVAHIAARAPAAKSGHPFFLYLPLNAPHTPVVPSAKWKRPHPLGHYACFVEEVDDTVGQILDALDTHGLAENTLLIVTSDNGYAPYVGIVEGDDRRNGTGGVKALEDKGHFPSANYRGYKSELWEGGHRVPFLVRWAGTVAPGSVCHGLTGLQDLYATVAELTDADIPPDAAEDSLSFLPLLRGRPANRQSMILHSVNGRFAIREGDWKLVAWRWSGGFSDRQKKPDGTPVHEGLPDVQLYDLANDPAESVNLAESEPATVKRLLALLEKNVAEGRTTPGPIQANDAPVKIIKP